MLVTINWLIDYVDIDCDVDTLADKLVGAGFEVEEIVRLADGCKGVVAGRIDSLERHPDADSLQICSINIGNMENIQVVTGANNIRVGDLVPLATEGSQLPNGMNIKKGKLRGVMSYGMLCSGGELKLTEQDYAGAEVDGIMILNGDINLGTDINKVLGNDDIVMDIGVTANRPDCNSVFGIAREIATLLNKPIHLPNFGYECSNERIEKNLSVRVENKELCPRYMAGLIKDIVIKPSPKYIQSRLRAVGLRPINNIVDITNYVLIELGQPMHAFDYSHINGGKIVVRVGANETITALDSKQYILDDTILTIADENKPSAIAGVIGGLGSGISSDTNTVVFESAKFLRENIRRTSRKINIRTDSSSRYERGIDIASQELGLNRALALIWETKSGKIANGIIDITNQSTKPRQVLGSIKKINAILGIKVPVAKMVKILDSLQISTQREGDKLICSVPLYREDIETNNDLAEEIIRLYGYQHIEPKLFAKSEQTRGGKTIAQDNLDWVKRYLCDSGMYETLTYSFTSPKMFSSMLLPQDSPLRNVVKLINPLGEDLSIMRTTLCYSLLEVVSKNLARNNNNFAIFEIANVYSTTQEVLIDLPEERQHLAFAMVGDSVDFYRFKEIIQQIAIQYGLNESYIPSKSPYLHGGISADIFACERLIGSFGEVHPMTLKAMDIRQKVYIAEIDIDVLNELYNYKYTFSTIPKFPTVERDIAVLVSDNVLAADILRVVDSAGGKILASSSIFDVYTGKGIESGFKSVAIKTIFRASDRSLVDEEINGKIEKILSRLESELSAKLR